MIRHTTLDRMKQLHAGNGTDEGAKVSPHWICTGLIALHPMMIERYESSRVTGYGLVMPKIKLWGITSNQAGRRLNRYTFISYSENDSSRRRKGQGTQYSE